MRSVYVNAEVDLADVLYDASTEELLDELRRRGSEESAVELVPLLKKARVPNDLIDPIDRWLRQPVANESLLEKWKAWVAGRPVNGAAGKTVNG
jgi:hypothetical protein